MYIAIPVLKHSSSHNERSHFNLEAVAQLEKSGYSVELVPSVHLNHVEIEAKGRTVFQCNIRFFEFNGDGEDDPLCRRAVQEVDDLYSRIAGRRPKVEPRAEVMSWRETEVENGSDTVEVAHSASSEAERLSPIGKMVSALVRDRHIDKRQRQKHLFGFVCQNLEICMSLFCDKVFSDYNSVISPPFPPLLFIPLLQAAY
ncbi:unnamed protein product [Timema podura]|uniref:Uncharacterized protein n=1 Tax=Timema podura TaxID=61482 RepID=A0ABN7NIC0_TIMPD|nr:unnamed protein product [Timema podura]